MNVPSSPSSSSLRVSRELFTESGERELFLECIHKGNAGRDAVFFLKSQESYPTWVSELVPWGYKQGFCLTNSNDASHSLEHTSGTCYLLEASSLFMASPLHFITSQNRPHETTSVLDVCASPGGKSVIAAGILRPHEQVANEVIKKRLGSLHGNFQRCHLESIKITSLDTSQLSQHAGTNFEVVIVDAPCSGQSMEARGEISAGCFLDVTVKKCAMRQRRIIANSALCVAQGGYLLYSTCTYSRDENEKVIEWFLKKFQNFTAVELPELSAHRSSFSEEPCYRLFPQSHLGAGGFTCLLKCD